MLKTICIATLTTMMALAPAYTAETPKECTESSRVIVARCPEAVPTSSDIPVALCGVFIF